MNGSIFRTRYLCLLWFVFVFLKASAVEDKSREISGRWDFVCYYDTLTSVKECEYSKKVIKTKLFFL